MAQTSGPRLQMVLAFLVGALVVAAVAIGLYVYSRAHAPPVIPSRVSLDLNLPRSPLPDGPKMPPPPIPQPK